MKRKNREESTILKDDINVLFYSTCVPDTSESDRVFTYSKKLKNVSIETKAFIFFSTNEKFDVPNDMRDSGSRAKLATYLTDKYEIPTPPWEHLDIWTEHRIPENYYIDSEDELNYDMFSEQIMDGFDKTLNIDYTQYDVIIKCPYIGEEASDGIEGHDIKKWQEKLKKEEHDDVSKEYREFILNFID